MIGVKAEIPNEILHDRLPFHFPRPSLGSAFGWDPRLSRSLRVRRDHAEQIWDARCPYVRSGIGCGCVRLDVPDAPVSSSEVCRNGTRGTTDAVQSPNNLSNPVTEPNTDQTSP